METKSRSQLNKEESHHALLNCLSMLMRLQSSKAIMKKFFFLQDAPLPIVRLKNTDCKKRKIAISSSI